MSRNLVLVILAVGFLSPSTSLFAATQNGTVYGTVYDASGNPMQGVTVTLENSALGFSRGTITAADGSYNFAEVPPAHGYRITATNGSKKLDARSGITVNVGDERAILPPLGETTGQPAAQTKAVEAVQSDTASTAVSGVITGEQLRSLPLYNRNFLALGLLTPETHDLAQGSPLTGASFSISGMRPSSNDFLLDGSDNVASSTNQAVPFQVNDSIQEFRVISADATAEYGRNMGGVINVLTSRSVNAFHGSVYGYFGNDALNANGPLSVYNGTTFDKTAAYAGAPTVDAIIGTNPAALLVFPTTYNTYVNAARNNGFCTDSIAGQLVNPRSCIASGAGADTFFDPAGILKTHDRFKQPFDSKQFGANAGWAPIKDKLFVFGSYEGTRIDNPNPIFERVPSTFDKTYNPLNDPTTSSGRMLFSPTSPDYLLAQNILSLFPASNVVGVLGVLEFFQGQAPNYTHVHNALLRADWVRSDKTALSARYVSQLLRELHDDSLPAPTTADRYPGNGAVRHALNQNLSVLLFHSFNSAIINELRVGFNRFNVRESGQDSNFDARRLGVVGASFPNAAIPTILLNGLDPQYSGSYLGADGAFGGWTEFLSPMFSPTPMAPSLDGFFPLARIGPPLNTPSSTVDTTVFGGDNVNFTRGRHSMKAGFELRWLRNEVFNGAYQRGFVYSANIGEFAHDSESCNQFCSVSFAAPDAFLRPSFDFARLDNSPYVGDFRSWAPATFFQDTWRVTSHITVNSGLRYEYFSPPTESLGRTWNFDQLAGGLVPSTGNPATVDPFGNTCNPAAFPFFKGVPASVTFPTGPWTNCSAVGNSTIPAKYTDFAPRFGVAWDVSGSGTTVARLGVGLFWDQLPVNYVSQLLLNRPVTDINAFYGELVNMRPMGGPCPSVQCGLGNSVINPAFRAAATMDGFPTPAGVTPNGFWSATAFPSAIYARDASHAKTPHAIQLNLSVQRRISENLAVEVGYVGTLGRNLPLIFNSHYDTQFSPINLANPNFSGDGSIRGFPVFMMSNQAESDYHSLVMRLRAAEWYGLRVNATYVFSRSLDNASNSLYNTEPVALGNAVLEEVFGTANPSGECFLSPATCTRLTFPNVDFSSAALTTTGAGQILVTPYFLPQDPFHFLSDERGRSDFDVTHRLVLDHTWEVPSLQKRFGLSKWWDYWQLSDIFIIQSGQPFTIFTAPPSLVDLTQRANLVGSGPTLNMSNPNAAISASGLASPFVTCGFRPAPNTACTGDSPRNGFTGPNFVNYNFAIQKGFPIRRESQMLTIRAEFFNLFNRANYYNPISLFSSDGVNVNPNFGKIKSAHDPLQVQFAARLAW